jgi:uncharacterized protein
MQPLTRRASLALMACLPLTAKAQPQALSLHTAGAGSVFLPYGQGLARFLKASGGPEITVVETSGSIANLRAVEASPTSLGTVFLGSAQEALAGAGAFSGQKLTNIRALFPMYETSFQTGVLASSGITAIRQLSGKKVGVGPKGGPAEGYFRGLMQITGITPEIINGTPAEQAKALLAGEIDGLWQGASVPIPSLKSVADQAETTILGIEAEDERALARLFPALAATTVPARSYRGQSTPIGSVAAWNFVVAHKDMPEAMAATITRLALSAQDPVKDIHASAAGTRKDNAQLNGIIPFHLGAQDVYRQAGIKLPAY